MNILGSMAHFRLVMDFLDNRAYVSGWSWTS